MWLCGNVAMCLWSPYPSTYRFPLHTNTGDLGSPGVWVAVHIVSFYNYSASGQITSPEREFLYNLISVGSEFSTEPDETKTEYWRSIGKPWESQNNPGSPYGFRALEDPNQFWRQNLLRKTPAFCPF